jgi:hypothetical protein
VTLRPEIQKETLVHVVQDVIHGPYDSDRGLAMPAYRVELPTIVADVTR